MATYATALKIPTLIRLGFLCPPPLKRIGASDVGNHCREGDRTKNKWVLLWEQFSVSAIARGLQPRGLKMLTAVGQSWRSNDRGYEYLTLVEAWKEGALLPESRPLTEQGEKCLQIQDIDAGLTWPSARKLGVCLVIEL